MAGCWADCLVWLMAAQLVLPTAVHWACWRAAHSAGRWVPSWVVRWAAMWVCLGAAALAASMVAKLGEKSAG